jgi:GR25 family glycosyltransferase involved in LPS biosynthesis
MIQRDSEIACWHSHFEVLRKIADGDDDVALIFEDDIDMEWDLERRLRYLWQFLPDKWDLVLIGMLCFCLPVTSVFILWCYAGHCFSYEYEKEPLPGTSYLYPSTSPLCTHAYAVTKKSATRLVRFLRSSLYAYSRPVGESNCYI